MFSAGYKENIHLPIDTNSLFVAQHVLALSSDSVCYKGEQGDIRQQIHVK